jgi:serine/threonine protein kinase
VTFPSDRVRYLDPDGGIVDAKVVELWADDLPARSPLTSGRVRLDVDGMEFDARYLVPIANGPHGSTAGYEQLDNEILAGLRIARLYGRTGGPAEVPRLIGRYLDSAESFVLTEPPQGAPAGRVAGNLLTKDARAFQKSLLRAVLVIGGAGIAHRGIGPDTVLWDSATRTLQLTGFAHAAPLGAPRTVRGTMPWQAPEQRQGRAKGTVSDRDDLWAAGKLIYFMQTGEELDDPSQLHDEPDLSELLQGVFRAPDQRPNGRARSAAPPRFLPFCADARPGPGVRARPFGLLPAAGAQTSADRPACRRT